MSDILKCDNKKCPLKETCYRWLAPNGLMQSYLVPPPMKNGKCEYYWEKYKKSN